MSDLDHLRLDHHRDQTTSSVFPSSAYYQSPENMYDIATPRGRELLDEVYPSSPNRSGEAKQSGWLILIIAALILFVMIT
jgi:hypothetical protein